MQRSARPGIEPGHGQGAPCRALAPSVERDSNPRYTRSKRVASTTGLPTVKRFAAEWRGPRMASYSTREAQ